MTASYRPPSHLFFMAFKPAVCPPALKCPRMPCQGSSPSYRPQPSVFHSVQACRLPALKCFRGLAKATLPATGPSLAKATLAATGPSHLFLRAFKAAVCPPPNASACLAKATLAATRPSHLFLRALKAAVCPPPNASAGLAKATLAATGPSHLFLRAFKAAVCPPPNASAGLASRQLSQLQAPAIYF